MPPTELHRATIRQFYGVVGFVLVRVRRGGPGGVASVGNQGVAPH